MEREAGSRVMTFIPRRMDLVPEAVRAALPLYYSEDLTLFTSHFPLPIFRTVNLMKFDYKWFRQIMFQGAGLDTGQFESRFPNNHWSVNHPFGVCADGLAYLASKYKQAVLNGSKATVGVTVRMYVDPLVPPALAGVGTGGVLPGPGIPIDCWFGSPETPREMRALASYWSPVRTYLNEGDESVDVASSYTQRQFQDETFYAKSAYGTSSIYSNPTDLNSEAEMPWGYHTNLLPVGGATPDRPDLKWLMQQTTEEGPNRFKHRILFPSAPGRKFSYGSSASMKAVYNPQAYWGSFIKQERVIEDDLQDKVSPQDHLDAIKAYNVAPTTEGVVVRETWDAGAGAQFPSTQGFSTIAGQNFAVASNTLFDTIVATEANGEGGGLAYNQIMPHLWVCMFPRNTSDSIDQSWTWPAFYDSSGEMTDLDAAEWQRRQGITFSFGVKQKFYLMFTDRVDAEDVNDVLMDR